MTQGELPANSGGWRPVRLGWSPAILGSILLVSLAAAGYWWRYAAPREDRQLEAGLASLHRGDLAGARRCFVQLSDSPNARSKATYLRGAILLEKGYYYPALDELKKIQTDPLLARQSLILIGQVWYHLGRHLEAQQALKKVLESQPDAVDAHRWLAASYYDLGAIHDALHHLERTADLDRGDHRPSRLIGLIYKDYERYSDAIPAYEESLRRKSDQPDWTDVREELASCQIKLRQYQAALTTLKPCPPSAAVLVLQAECQHAVGDAARAVATLQQALSQDPDNLDALVLRGSIWLEEGNHAQAIEVFRQAIKVSPQDYMAHFKLAQAYGQANDPTAAAAEQKSADRIREIRKVFADLHRAAWDHPEDISIRMRLAELARELGRPDLEQVWLKSAAALQPQAPSTR